MTTSKIKGLTVFINQLNQRLAIKLNDKDYLFSPPNTIPAAISPSSNTQVRINSRQVDSSYGFSYKYNRVALEGIDPITVFRGSAKTIYDLLDSINLATEDIICEDDIFDAELPLVNAPREMKVVLRAKPDSYIWLGQVEITVTT